MLILCSPHVGQAGDYSEPPDVLGELSKERAAWPKGAKNALSWVLPKAREIRPEDSLTQDIIDALAVKRDTMRPGSAPSNKIRLQHDLHELVMDTLGPESARVRDYRCSSFVDTFLEGEILKDRNWAFMTYMLLVLELWLRECA